MELPDKFLLSTFLFIGTIVWVIFHRFVLFECNVVESRKAKPYTNIGHPKKFLIEKLIGIMFPYIVPIHKLGQISHRIEEFCSRNENEHKKILREVRSRLHDFFEKYLLHLPTCFIWNRLVTKSNNQDFLVGGTVIVSRETNILSEWGFEGSSISTHSDSGDDMLVEIEITCPASVIGNNITFQDSGSIYKKFDKCKFEELNLSPSAPIILYFHGGGFAVGSPRDTSPYFMYSLSKYRPKESKTPLPILASVKYRLSPENPFPAGLIDCLSAAKFIVERFSNVHISGFSAGGNFATVVGFECVRKFPGKLKSVIALNPTLSPRCDTISFHMNSKSSNFCPSSTLLWFWAAYLQLGDYKDKNGYNAELEKNKFFKFGYAESMNPMLRLLCPQVDIPKVELKSDGAPIFFVITGTADPLCDDGKDFAKILRDEGVNTYAFDLYGDHGMSILLDIKKFNEFMKQWGTVVYS